MKEEIKKVYKVEGHTIDENVNILRCKFCNQKPYVAEYPCINPPEITLTSNKMTIKDFIEERAYCKKCNRWYQVNKNKLCKRCRKL